jgi:hypothetical protein
MKDLEELVQYLTERIFQFRLHHGKLLAQDDSPERDVECQKIVSRVLEIDHILNKISTLKKPRLTKRQVQAKGLAP